MSVGGFKPSGFVRPRPLRLVVHFLCTPPFRNRRTRGRMAENAETMSKAREKRKVLAKQRRKARLNRRRTGRTIPPHVHQFAERCLERCLNHPKRYESAEDVERDFGLVRCFIAPGC